MIFFVRCKQTGLSATGVCFLLFFLLLLQVRSFLSPSPLRAPLAFIAGGPWFVWRCCHHLDAVLYTWRRKREVCWHLSQILLCHVSVCCFYIHTHLSAFRSPSTLLDGCSFSTLMQPFICWPQRQHMELEKGQQLQISHIACCCCCCYCCCSQTLSQIHSHLEKEVTSSIKARPVTAHQIGS